MLWLAWVSVVPDWLSQRTDKSMRRYMCRDERWLGRGTRYAEGSVVNCLLFVAGVFGWWSCGLWDGVEIPLGLLRRGFQGTALAEHVGHSLINKDRTCLCAPVGKVGGRLWSSRGGHACGCRGGG